MIQQQPITLEEIQRRKKQIRKQLRMHKKQMQAQANGLLQPVPVRNKLDLGYRWVSNGMALYDGLKMGWKVIRFFTKR